MLSAPPVPYFLREGNSIFLEAVLILLVLISRLDFLLYSVWLLFAFYICLILLLIFVAIDKNRLQLTELLSPFLVTGGLYLMVLTVPFATTQVALNRFLVFSMFALPHPHQFPENQGFILSWMFIPFLKIKGLNPRPL